MAKNKMIQSEFYCTKCGKKGLPVWRRKGDAREDGHLKVLYCLFCNDYTNHVECKPNTPYSYEDFKIEYEYGNFTEDGQRTYTLKQIKGLVRDGKIEKQKDLDGFRNTWNREEYLDSES